MAQENDNAEKKSNSHADRASENTAPVRTERKNSNTTNTNSNTAANALPGAGPRLTGGLYAMLFCSSALTRVCLPYVFVFLCCMND